VDDFNMMMQSQLYRSNINKLNANPKL